MKHIYGLGMLLCAVSAMSPLPTYAELAPDIVLSEIAWAGSARSASDEWIEIWNRGAVDVDVGGWFITGIGTSGSAILIANDTVIPAGSTIVIANYSKGDEKSTLNITPTLVTTAVSIPNTALDITLAQPDGAVVDQYKDAGDPEYGSKITFASMERDPVTLAWRTSEASLGLLDGQLGSPGSVNTPIIESPSAEITGDPTPEPPSPPSTPDEEFIETDTPPITTTLPDENAPTEAPVESEPIPPEPLAIDPIEEPVIELDVEPDTESIIEPTIDPIIEPIVEPEPMEAAEPPMVNEGISEPVDEFTENPPQVIEEIPTKVTPTTEIIPTPSFTPDMVRFNEILSRPSGGTEWVELASMHDAAIDLLGWYMIDASGKKTNLSGVLESGGFVLIENPNGKLNNDGDTLTLFAPNGVIAVIEYGAPDLPAPDVDESAIWIDGEWKISPIPTPRAENILILPKLTDIITYAHDTPKSTAATQPASSTQTAPAAESTADHQPDAPAAKTPTPSDDLVAYVATPVTVKSSGTPSSKTTPSSKASSTKKSSSAQLTKVIGSVVALPGLFGKQIMYINGQEIYFNAAEWPALRVNDLVEITGTPSTADGNNRLKISSANQIRVIGTQTAEAVPYNTALAHGTLTTISGTIVERTASGFIIETERGERVPVTLDNDAGIPRNSIVAGQATIVGIYRNKSGVGGIYPRSSDDLQIETAPLSPTAAAGTSSSLPNQPWLGLGLLLGSSGALGAWYLRARMHSRATLTLQPSNV